VTRRWLAALLLGAAVIPLAHAQEGPTERVRVDYVLIDVIALDKKNRPITDLTREDFTVTENRQKIDLRSFETLDLRVRVPGADAAPATVAVEGVPGAVTGEADGVSRYLLALDVEFARPAERGRAFRQVREFLDGTAARPDVAYLLYSFAGGTLSQGFEHSPERLKAALSEHEKRYGASRSGTRASADKSYGGVGGADDLPELEERFDDCRTHFMDGSMGVQDPARYQQCVLDDLRLFLELQLTRAQRALAELESLAGRFPGRDRLNTIFLVSPGFSLRPGTAAIELAELYLDTRRLESEDDDIAAFRGSGTLLPAAPSVEEEFQRVVDLCLRNRVVFHTFDVLNYSREGSRQIDGRFGGTRRPGAVAIHRRYGDELNRGLDELAGRSGGVFYSGPNLERMSTLMDVGRFVYTLGYNSPPEGKPFRRVKIKCKRKGVRLLHRPGYFPS
jgi:VWFA-related protein